LQVVLNAHADLVRLLQKVMVDAVVPATEAKAAMLCDWVEALRSKVDWLAGDIRGMLYSRDSVRAMKTLKSKLQTTYSASRTLNVEVRMCLPLGCSNLSAAALL
jgi:hypothetical protein